ncbi:MAG TPA: PAS domain S-box protein [Cytophagaceae bacterium]|nr:PAS domain S-box protein [Cytophagaceae bacterium]
MAELIKMHLLEYWLGNTPTEFSLALLIIGIIVLLVILIWYNAVSLNKKDALRKETEEKLSIANRQLESIIAEHTQKLQTTEMEYHSLIEQATDGIFISDAKGNYTDVNDSACKMLGYSKEELLKMNSADILLAEDAQKNPPRLEELRAGKALLSTRILRRKDGSTLPAEISGKMLTNGKMLGVVRDITERKKAEEKLAASELLFRQTLDNMLEGIQIHDFDWRYTYVNDSLVKYSHYTKEELLGYTLMEKYPGIEQSELFGVLKECMVERTSRHFETEFVFPNGDKAFFELSVEPLPTGLFILSIDITERKKVEEKNQKLHEELEQKVVERTKQLEQNIQRLTESEEKFQKAFRASAAGMTITRLSDSTYVEVNEAFLEMTGFAREEAIGHSSAELGFIRDIKKREAILQQIREQGWAKQFEMTVHHKSGDILEVLASVETIMLNGEKFALNIIFDITDRMRAERQLEEANQELEAFSYSISHDLRAPLRAIDGYAKMIEEDYQKLFDSEGKRLLEVIQDNARRMSNLIDDLLEFSRLGRKAIHKTDLNMNTLISGVLHDLQKTIPAKTEIKVDDLQGSKGDYTLISQVMVNLLSNAIKYSSGKEHPVVEIYSEEKDGSIVYTVKDNGAGFDMRYVNKLFGVFQRLHSAKEFEGTGVGLAIVHRIIEKHGGKIWAEAELGHGASFHFLLPLS